MLTWGTRFRLIHTFSSASTCFTHSKKRPKRSNTLCGHRCVYEHPSYSGGRKTTLRPESNAGNSPNRMLSACQASRRNRRAADNIGHRGGSRHKYRSARDCSNLRNKSSAVSKAPTVLQTEEAAPITPISASLDRGHKGYWLDLACIGTARGDGRRRWENHGRRGREAGTGSYKMKFSGTVHNAKEVQLQKVLVR